MMTAMYRAELADGVFATDNGPACGCLPGRPGLYLYLVEGSRVTGQCGSCHGAIDFDAPAAADPTIHDVKAAHVAALERRAA